MDIASDNYSILNHNKLTFSLSFRFVENPLKKYLFLVILLGMFTTILNAQSSSDEDKEIITQTTLNYISNFFLNDWKAMKESFHSKMVKRGINDDLSYQEISLQYLKEMMKRKRILKLEKQENTVEVLHLSKNTASVLLNTGYPTLKWKEHIHLAIENNKWKIINILWDYGKN